MAVIVKRLIYPITPTSGSAAKYIRSFDTLDWGVADGDYAITITVGTHATGVNPRVAVYLDNNVTFEEVETEININALGDVTIKVSSSPDNRFKGKITIL